MKPVAETFKQTTLPVMCFATPHSFTILTLTFVCSPENAANEDGETERSYIGRHVDHREQRQKGPAEEREKPRGERQLGKQMGVPVQRSLVRGRSRQCVEVGVQRGLKAFFIVICLNLKREEFKEKNSN